ncbi:MAG: RelA/SpoT family protein [Thermochromatium sp.]
MVKPLYHLPEPHTDDAEAIRHWLDSLETQYPADERACLARACEVLARVQGERHPDTGETRVRYALSSADILVRLHLDHEALVAALLKGCLELGEQPFAPTDFGPRVMRLVEDLVRLDQFATIEAVVEAKDQAKHEENLRRLLLGLTQDVRVVLIALAERVHLMRAIKDLEPERRAKLARDTQRVYAPLANRLGIWQVKWELEDLSLRYLHPDDYHRIAKLLAERREEREHYIATVIAILRERFAEVGLRAEITGRPKHIYSIWKKMQRKNVDLTEIFDLRAVRLLVDSVADCYAALGVVHGLWRHIPGEFDDYIANPKGNGYQSLHTAVEGPEGKALEVQIRTHAMHQYAEFGVAAHWAYKEARGHDAEFQRQVIWMRQWLESRDEASGERLERFKTEFEPAHIYVLTPQSKVIELPKGATPLDFAYAIHSEIGHRCRGAKVNERIVPLNYRLHSGDTVEILTQKNAAPSRDWLNPQHGYLTTARARNRVRQWFKQQDFDKHLHEGRELLERELARLGIGDKPLLDEIAHRFNFRRGDDLLAAIGRGDLAVGQVARQVGEPRAEEAKKGALDPELKTRVTKAKARPSGVGGDVIIAGISDLMTRLASCCKPVPGDPIVGFVTRGRGVTIHRCDCANIRHLSGEERARLVEARWAERREGGHYPVDLLVVAADRKGLLRDVSSIFADADVAVIGVETHSERSTDTASMRFTIEVEDNAHLERLMTKLQQLPEVHQVRRFR